jgi:DNA invertase Pin-like site-specific DNA recombinase
MTLQLDRHPTRSSGLIRAAQYVRMSTEHQQYSTENQSQAIRRYAEAHGMEIVRTYSDSGKSGLNLSGRAALQELLREVEGGLADYSVILVYDISRWGRFQDADESAYYEYVCKRANVRVHYCAEQFENDGSLPSSLMKTMKRTMAGEYSRELSVKVFAGQCRQVELGYRQGGPAGYGLRRRLFDVEGRDKGILVRGQKKSIQTDRVILVPGPENEVEVVRQIYDLFTRHGKSESEISGMLNLRGLMNELDRPWTSYTVRGILTNPKYAGCNVYNRRSFKLKRKRVRNPPEMWIRKDNAFTPVVTREQFSEALRIIYGRCRHLSNEQLLGRLKELLDKNGSLSAILINETEGMPSTFSYRKRFGSLTRAYTLIGYAPSRDLHFIEANRALRRYHSRQVAEIVSRLQQIGATVDVQPSTDLLNINHEFSAAVVLARCRQTPAGDYRWLIRLENSLDPDVTIAARLQPGNQDILDYYLLPRLAELSEKLRLAPDNGIVLDVYRFENLNFFIGMGRRTSLEETVA